MSEYLSLSRDKPPTSLLLGIASATAAVSLMGGCASDETNKTPEDDAIHHVTAPFRCEGTPGYIEYPPDSEFESYIVMKLTNKDGSTFRGAEKVKLTDFGGDYTETITQLTHEGHATRAPVELPADVVQLGVEVSSGDDQTSCATIFYPNQPRPTFTDIPPPPAVK